jgi:hypothetical protein
MQYNGSAPCERARILNFLWGTFQNPENEGEREAQPARQKPVLQRWKTVLGGAN